MKLMLEVRERKEVDVPDLAADLVELVRRYDGRIEAHTSTDLYEGSTEGFAELWVTIEASNDYRRANAMWDALGELDSFDETTMAGMSQPYHQSDSESDEGELAKWIDHQVQLHGDVIRKR